MSLATEKMVPLTLEELKESLTPAERNEADNPDFLHQLELYVEGVKNISDLDERRRKCMIEATR